MNWWGRLRKSKQLETELDAELRFHFEAHVEAHMRNGIPESEARRRARIEFGGLDQVKEDCRDVRGTRWIEDTAYDLRFATRMLRRNQGFTIAVVLTLGLGVGATSAIFSVAYGVLLRPLPYKDSQSLVLIQPTSDPSTGVPPAGGLFAAPELTDWVERTRTFESLALHSEDIFAVAGERGLETVLGSYVSERFFETLGQPMAVGRPPQDPLAPEAVVSYRFWQRRLGGETNVVGREIQLNGRAFTIAGVAMPDFGVPTDNTDIWTSVNFASPTATGNRRRRRFALLARLRPGISLGSARADAEGVARSLAVDYPESNRGYSATVVSLREHLTGSVRPALVLLLAAVSLVLFVACTNVANLLLVRRASRSHEIAVRAALGASRGRLARQLLAEGTLLAVGGAATGIAIAYVAVAVLLRLQPESFAGVRPDVLLPRLDAVRVDAAAFLFALAASAIVTLLATIVPAVQSADREPARGLKIAAHTQSGGPAARRLRSMLVVAELSISLVLLVGAGLLARSFVHLLRTDTGVTADRVVTIELNAAMGRTLTNARQIELTEELLNRVRRLPNVEAVGAASMLPLTGVRMVASFAPANQPDGQTVVQSFAMLNPTPGYFSALGILLLKGRLFSDADGPSSPPVMILGSSMARRFFGTADPIGRTLPYKNAPTIVGVVADVKYGGLADLHQEVLYLPFAQQPFRSMFIVARTTGDPIALAPDLRKAIHGLDPEVMIGPVRTLDAIASDVVAHPRFRTLSLAGIATVALALAAIGLYGVIAYSVSLRTTEIGVRMALGAHSGSVVRLIMREGVGLALAGTAIGIGMAYTLSRTIQGFLYGVTPADASSYALAAVFLLVIALTATYVPARRATRIDPLIALRAE